QVTKCDGLRIGILPRLFRSLNPNVGIVDWRCQLEVLRYLHFSGVDEVLLDPEFLGFDEGAVVGFFGA
ncbi:MAG: hypothetical protein Q9190_008108, partial [Brigantiaea leucoxantha]